MTYLIRLKWLLNSVRPSEAELWIIQIGASEFSDPLNLSAHKKKLLKGWGWRVFFGDTRDLI